jgi:hypothetical protein
MALRKTPPETRWSFVMSAKGPKPSPREEPSDDELLQVRDVLERTMRFLARCSEDPEAAVRSEDPHELMRGLRELAQRRPEAAPDADTSAKELPTIPLRKRRSA